MKEFDIKEELKSYDELLYNIVEVPKDKASTTLYNEKREEIIKEFERLKKENEELKNNSNNIKL